MADDLKKAYRTIMDDHFPPRMEISFIDGEQRTTLGYEKVTWVVGEVEKGLRYGENPGQEAALYRLTAGNLMIGEAELLRVVGLAPAVILGLACAGPLRRRAKREAMRIGLLIMAGLAGLLLIVQSLT